MLLSVRQVACVVFSSLLAFTFPECHPPFPPGTNAYCHLHKLTSRSCSALRKLLDQSFRLWNLLSFLLLGMGHLCRNSGPKCSLLGRKGSLQQGDSHRAQFQRGKEPALTSRIKWLLSNFSSRSPQGSPPCLLPRPLLTTGMADRGLASQGISLHRALRS